MSKPPKKLPPRGTRTGKRYQPSQGRPGPGRGHPTGGGRSNNPTGSCMLAKVVGQVILASIVAAMGAILLQTVSI